MRKLSRDQVISVFNAKGVLKKIAYEHGVSTGIACKIRNGTKHRAFIREWRATLALNATLATLAVYPEAQ